MPQKFVEGLKAKTGIRWMNQSFITNWGSMNLVNAILLLCEVALTEEDNTHFHLISGADFPAATNSEIIATCSSEKDNYIEFFPMPTPRWKEGGMNRLLYFHPLDILNSRNSMDRGTLYTILASSANSWYQKEIVGYNIFWRFHLVESF